MRGRTGKRRHVATFQRHNGNVDAIGNPTYSTEADWTDLAFQFPCEVLTVSGGESRRGAQVSDTTTHLLFGDYYDADGVLVTDRLVLDDGRVMHINGIIDLDGDAKEIRIEAQVEQ